MYTQILIRYGELSLKGDNKKIFISKLAENIFKILNVKVEAAFDRMYVPYTPENYEKLGYVFGISSYSPVVKVETNYDVIEKAVLELFNSKNKNFKVNCRRNWKSFHLTSDEVNRKIATALFSQYDDLKVDVKNPTNLVSIEIRKEFTYIFLESTKGIGGLPVGSSGKALHLISGGIDSPVAAYLMMKRGVQLDYLSFITPPHTDEKTVEKVDKIISLLNKYQGGTKLFQVNYTDLMNYIGLTSKQSFKITLMRRSFYRIASIIAKEYNYLALSNGENLGQVASQTIESMHVIGKESEFQIYRPLVTFDKMDVVAIGEKIGTYQISIERAEEACELFAPKNPVIKPKMREVEYLEQELNMIKEMEQKLIERKLQIKRFKNCW